LLEEDARSDTSQGTARVESYRRLADVFHDVLAEQSLDALLDRIADALAELVPHDSLTIYEADEPRRLWDSVAAPPASCTRLRERWAFLRAFDDAPERRAYAVGTPSIPEWNARRSFERRKACAMRHVAGPIAGRNAERSDGADQ